ncbi:MAG: phosphate acyltransferase PlsX [Thermodesulfobacteriota bacterium]
MRTPRRPCIAVDAMGGDFGPQVVVPGAVSAAQANGLGLVFVGQEETIQPYLEQTDTSGIDVDIADAREVVAMSDKPSQLRRKQDTSIQKAFLLVKKGQADGVVSAGNSGASLACGMFTLGRIKGIERPALASILPTEKNPLVLIDVGANVDCKARHLFQFGLMADVLAQDVLKITAPRVGILSIGEEEGKGNALVRDAYTMLSRSSLNFVGNVEGRDIFGGDIDVAVCDGFVGNVALKISEGLATSLSRILKRELATGVLAKMGCLLARDGFRRFARRVDYAEYGGAPLLGLNGITIVCHGASNRKAISSAVAMAGTFVQNKANDHLVQGLTENTELSLYGRHPGATEEHSELPKASSS